MRAVCPNGVSKEIVGRRRGTINDLQSLGLRSASAAAVLLIKRRQRIFAVAFGQGRHLLKTGALEENFGLYASMNSIDPLRIRSIDRKRFDAISRLTREQAIREVSILNFGLELDQDVLRSVTGRPSDEAIGKRFTGRDSLSVAVPAELSDLPALMDRYFAKARETTYRQTFPGVGNIEEVRESVRREGLDLKLIERIRSRNFDRMWLAVPDLLEWADMAGFTYSGARDAERHDDIAFEAYLAQLNDPDALSLAMLKRHKVTCHRESTDGVIDDWPIYRCIYAEMDWDDGTYILDNGKWYRVDRDLVSLVNREIRDIPQTSVQFPAYRHLEEESKYNARFAASNPTRYALMDQKSIRRGGGQSQIEFCDVFTKNGVMIHVKRYRGSHVMSHLFAQGIVPATALMWDEMFRKDLNRKLPATHKLRNPLNKPSPSNYEVAYAIASKAPGQLILPFFSRVILRNSYRQLVSYGFRVTCTKIDIEPQAGEGS